MKQFGLGRRLMSLLLALAMIVALIPAIAPTEAKAAVGDITNISTGLTGNIDTSDTISWPIKIYDYLNDGMLFEYSSAQDTSVTAHGGGSYGGGEVMPMIDYAIPGNDYTSIQGYYNYDWSSSEGYHYDQNYAVNYWGNRNAYSARYDGNATEVERSLNQPVDYQSPMSMHIEYVGTGTSKAYGWITNFARDGGVQYRPVYNYSTGTYVRTENTDRYKSKEEIRYMVIVYKTNDVYGTPIDLNGDGDYADSGEYAGNGHALRPYWAVDDATYSSSSVDISDLTDSWGWKAGGTNATGTLVAQEVRLKPSTDTWTYQIFDMKTDLQDGYGIAENWSKIKDKCIAGVGISYPLAKAGEEMDISHIAYFGSEEEAERFGIASVKFDNNPGRYMGYEIDMSQQVAGGSTISLPTNTLDFTVYGSGGWTNSTFKEWDDSGYDLNIDFSHKLGKSYAIISNDDSDMDTAYAWKSTGYYTANGYSGYTNLRYVTIVYRTHNISNPTLGFWIGDSYNDSYYQAGRYVNTSKSIPASEDEWVAYTYDLRWIQSEFGQSFSNKVDTFNRIGIKFPGFTNADQSMDIAYIAYTASDPTDFKTAALDHLSKVDGNTIYAYLSKSDKVVGRSMWNTGSNQAFTFLYGSTGGGWLADGSTGGKNTWTNGYYSYFIGETYMYDGTVNAERTAALSLGLDYRVSNSIYLLNTYSSSTSNLNGVDISYDSKGNMVKSFDMSKLDLGYTLYNTMLGSCVMTAGLLQSSQATFTGVDGKDYKIMQYKDDTIHYLATLLRDTLTIPEYDYWGFNYNFVKGTASAIYSEDYDGDGKLDSAEDIDGDGHLDVFEDKNRNGKLDKGEDLDFDGHLDVFEDMNRNGVLDIAEDIDGDGHIDVFEDLDGDGKLGPHEDIDGDGRLDLIEDLNHNGELDPGEDRNGNGKLDLTEDVNGNGALDVSEDLDGDGRLDLIEDKNSNGELDEGEDLNGNGVLDLTEDVNGNGILDPKEDKDGDGKLDLIEDLNSNGELDEGEDLNGNGKLDLTEDLDGDGFLDINEDLNGNKVLDKCDLATALRGRLGITFDWDDILTKSANLESAKGTYTAKIGGWETPANGSYVGTKEKVNSKDGNLLIGPYLQCAKNIDTFYDAAYYLLHNLFVANSYNQAQTDYNYMVLSKATVTAAGKEAYVFDAGFSNPDTSSAIVYNENNKTMSLSTALNKHHIYYLTNYTTTLHPFTPINDSDDAADDPFGINGTPYFREDGAVAYKDNGATYAGRNFNFVMQANGEFVYHAADDLFFDFEGDDDVYMFVNGELVLDIGAAHSITSVGFQMNDYVEAAQIKMAELSSYGYDPEMTDEELDALLAKVSGLTAAQKAEYKRMHRLNLIDGQSYPIDFYYMERHGWGANMRIATNIVMTDPTLVTDKSAYQGTDANGNPIEVEHGSLIDDSRPVGYSFAVNNNGNTKLYNISFSDPDIGLTLKPDAGLQTFGKATVTKFTVEADSVLSFKGFDGVVNLDGKVYNVAADGSVTWEEDGVTHDENGIGITFNSVNAGYNIHELRMYQYNTKALFQDVTASVIIDSTADNDASNITAPYTPTTDTNGVYGLQLDKVNKVVVQGVRVTNAQGNLLTPADLTFTIEGYASFADYQADKPITPITVKVENNDQLKAFLQTLQDPKNQTGTGEIIPEGQSSLYWGAGLWQHATLTVSGMHYTLSAAEQEAKVFNNTVYTTAYKSLDSDEVLKGQNSHQVYTPGEPMYFQWSDHDVYLTLDRLWDDVEENSKNESNMLFVQNHGITALTRGEDINGNGILDVWPDKAAGWTEDLDGDGRLDVDEDKNANGRLDPGEDLDKDGHLDVDEDTNANGVLDANEDINNNGVLDTGVDTLKLKLCDKHGNDLSRSDNMYAGGLWTTYDKGKNEDTADERTIYFQNNDRWGEVYIYYWSESNPSMTTWPGVKMTMVEDALYDVFAAKVPSDAEKVVFNIGSDTIKTNDLQLPSVDYNKVSWDDENRKLDVAYDNTGMHLFYVQVSSNVTSVKSTVRIPVTFYVTDVEDQTVVLDYGLQTEDLNAIGRLFMGDELLGSHNGIAASLMNVATSKPSYLSEFTADGKQMNRIDFTAAAEQSVDPETGVWSTPVKDDEDDEGGVDGKFYFSSAIDPAGLNLKHSGNSYTMAKRFWFQPTNFMDAEYDLWLNINVHQSDAVHSSNASTSDKKVYHTSGEVDIGTEAQMYKKVTVLPATVVYYEDDFAGVTYYTDKGEFTKLGDGSGNLTQGLDMNANYGWDNTYEYASNDEMSGNSMMSINLSNPDAVASFKFKGTGFELIGRTNAFDSATFVVKVTDSEGTVVRDMPVITEFTSTNKTCTHPYHNINGYCSYCGAASGHNYPEGSSVCSVCHATQEEHPRTFHLRTENEDLSGKDQFVDGKLTVAFGADRYVWVEDSTGKVYKTNGYPGDTATSATMYAGLAGDKLRVPGGVEVTFTLVDNGNGSVALSYIDNVQHGGERTVYFDNTNTNWEKVLIYYWSSSNDRMVDWPGVEMEPVSEGSKIYKYVLPSDAEELLFDNGSNGLGNQTDDFVIPGDNFIYANGVWSSYDNDGTVTLYLKNTFDDGEPHAYAWTYTAGTNKEYLGTWPGTKMTAVEGMEDYYSIEVSANAGKVIFSAVKTTTNDGVEEKTVIGQTGDLIIDPETPVYQKNGWQRTVRTIYYENTNDWAQVIATYWSDPDAKEPSVKMTDIGGGVFACEVPWTTKYINFGNGKVQTADAEIQSSSNMYSAGKWTGYSSNLGKQIHQVPTFRVKDLTYGEYTVEILGIPAYNFPEDFDFAANFDYTTGKLDPEKIKQYMVDSYLYLDGIRIYQPLGTTNDNYSAHENGAQFKELRDMILNGEAVVATYDVSTTVYSGNMSWTENRNDVLVNDANPDGAAFSGNQVSGIDDYMLVGPNNEVYMNGSLKKEAIVFYVSEDAAASTHNLQIAVRGIDHGLFTNGVSTGVNATLYQSAQMFNPTTGGVSYGWSVVSSIKSGTEQYYTIDYTKCPKINGKYQVALYVSDGMVSISSLKLNGLKIASAGISRDTCYSYNSDGTLLPRHTWSFNGYEPEPSCTNYGVATYVCTKCGAEKTVTMPYYHRCVNGICSVCNKRIVYFQSTNAAGVPKAFAWSSDAVYTSAWPGTTMRAVPGYSNLYVIAVDPAANNVVFNNGTGSNSNRTAHLTVPTDGKTLYNGAVSAWEALTDCQHESHDVDGKCAACGYTVEHTYVDGKCACGQAEEEEDGMITVYFDNSSTSWDNVYVYTWGKGDATGTGAWPGVKMTQVEGNIYSCEVPKEAKLVFHNGTSLTFPDGNAVYSITEGKWIAGVTCAHTYHSVEGRCYFCDIAVEHTYVDGVCGCGDVKKITIHYDNTATNWAKVNIYAFDASGNALTGTWPGNEMTLVEGNIYAYEVPVTADKVVFNDGTNQTSDLIIPTDGTNLYNSATSAWGAYGDVVVCQHETHDVNGKCTACGTAVEHVYVDSMCSCGLIEDNLMTIYFDNSGYKWSEIAVYAWNDSGNVTGDWPGVTMEFVEGSIYSVQISKDAKMIIFNNKNNGSQTGDLTIPTDGKNLYSSATQTWTTYGDVAVCQHPTHGQDGKCTDCGTAVSHSYVDGKCSCGLEESSAEDAVTLYLQPNANWKQADARFAAYFFQDGMSETWVSATLVGDNTYSVVVPDGYTNIIFCRMNPNTTENNWSNKWNQTADLTVPTDGTNCYVVADGTWDSGGGSWTTYVAEATALSLYTIDQQMQTLAGFADNELPSDDDGFQIENEIVERPDVKLEYPTISLEDEVTMQVYFSTDADVSAENVGIIAWSTAPTMLNKNDGMQGGILAENGLYRVSLPISAEKLGDEIYLAVFTELDDGTVIYSNVVTYSVKSYAYAKLADSSTDNELKTLLVSLLNYGAAAQVYFDYKTDALVNADLTAEQQALAEGYNADMVKPVAQPTGNKVSAFAANGGFNAKSATAHFESAFGISYHMTGSVESTGATLYFWTQEQFDALDVLDADNCTGSVAMDVDSGTFTGFVGGIAAKEINNTVYAATVYTGNDGVTYSTGVLAYSLGAYCANMVANGSEDMSALAAATVVYGFYASAYFGN